MADETNTPDNDQVKLAKEVLAGERTITASELKMAIPDDVKRQALEKAQGTREMLKETNLPQGTEANSDSHMRGPTTLPGENAGYGRNHNPMPQPEATPAPTPSPTPGPEPGG